MTNLSDFFADHDIAHLRRLGLDSHNIDICAVYCQHTGRAVGTFDYFTIQFACDEESSDDEEALVDALVTRAVAAMRPSPMLNKPDRLTLLNLAERFPVDIIAFLENRLYSNRHLATHRDADFLDPYIRRIAVHQRWTRLAASGVDPKPWIHWLLELDAKRSLHDLTPPEFSFDRVRKPFLVKSGGEQIFDCIDEQTHESMLALFEAWAFERLAEFDRRDNEALAQDRWMRGNSMTQTAYVRSWMENPQFASKKAEAAAKAKKRPATQAKPISEKTTKVNAKVSQFLHLLDDIIDGGMDNEATPAKPAPKVLTGAMLFRKKESN